MVLTSVDGKQSGIMDRRAVRTGNGMMGNVLIGTSLSCFRGFSAWSLVFIPCCSFVFILASLD